MASGRADEAMSPLDLIGGGGALKIGAIGIKGVLGGAGKFAIEKGETTLVKDLIATHGLDKSRAASRKLFEDISKNGIQDPIKYAIKDGEKFVVDGHHRLDAAKRLGFDSVPTQKVELPFAGYKSATDLEPHFTLDWMK